MGTFFTDRLSGNSSGVYASLNLGDHVGDTPEAVASNRALITAKFGPTQYMNQVHGNRVAIIEEVTEEIPTADALVTGIPGITLAVMVADCIPLLFKSSYAVAAVHVGRKGLLNRVAEKAIDVMREISDSGISAIIGPAICGKCYEVSDEIFNEVTKGHPDSASQTASGTPSLNLISALISDLQKLGITDIDNQSHCTLEHDDLYSYRRDGATGRQAGLVWL
jgi:YfiH family protein